MVCWEEHHYIWMLKIVQSISGFVWRGWQIGDEREMLGSRVRQVLSVYRHFHFYFHLSRTLIVWPIKHRGTISKLYLECVFLKSKHTNYANTTNSCDDMSSSLSKRCLEKKIHFLFWCKLRSKHLPQMFLWAFRNQPPTTVGDALRCTACLPQLKTTSAARSIVPRGIVHIFPSYILARSNCIYSRHT